MIFQILLYRTRVEDCLLGYVPCCPQSSLRCISFTVTSLSCFPLFSSLLNTCWAEVFFSAIQSVDFVIQLRKVPIKKIVKEINLPPHVIPRGTCTAKHHTVLAPAVNHHYEIPTMKHSTNVCIRKQGAILLRKNSSKVVCVTCRAGF